MPARRLSDTHVVIAAGALTVLFGGAVAFLDPPGGPGVERPSSFSAAASGGKAAFQTLKRLGYRVERSFEPMTAITAEPGGTTLLLTGSGGPSDQDRRALQVFVERGGVVLLVGAPGADFVRVTGMAGGTSIPRLPQTHRVLAPSPLAAEAPEITMVPGGGAARFGPAYVPVFAVSSDEPLVSTARVGSGRVIWWADATPLSNAHITEAGNLQLLLNVAGPPAARRILWDEHYHGHSRSLWSYAAGTPLPWLGAQLLLIALAAVAAYSRRPGPVRARPADPRTSPMEFIEMLLALYRRAGAAAAAVATARARFKRAVTSACGLPVDTADDALSRAAAGRIGVGAGEVADLLAASERARHDPNLAPSEALEHIRQLQTLTVRASSQRALRPATPAGAA